MKKITFAALPIAVLALCMNIVNDPLPIGSPIPTPELKMKNVNGKDVSLQEIKTAKGLLVMFSCNTCPYVEKNQSRTNEVCNYAIEQGIGVAVVNSNEGNRNGDDSFESMKAYAKKQNYTWHYLVDLNSGVADAFGANRTPECFLFDANGKLVYHGAIDDSPGDPAKVARKHLAYAIEEMQNGKEVTVKESKSIGCTIKRPK